MNDKVIFKSQLLYYLAFNLQEKKVVSEYKNFVIKSQIKSSVFFPFTFPPFERNVPWKKEDYEVLQDLGQGGEAVVKLIKLKNPKLIENFGDSQFAVKILRLDPRCQVHILSISKKLLCFNSLTSHHQLLQLYRIIFLFKKKENNYETLLDIGIPKFCSHSNIVKYVYDFVGETREEFFEKVWKGVCK